MKNEIWKDIPGYEDEYQVSNLGRVRSLDRTITDSWGRTYHHKGRIMVQTVTNAGYIHVYIRNKSFNTHRLVAEAFIPNPQNLPQVNHKDEDKMNNRADNLEWCNQPYNINYGTNIERIRSKHERQPVRQYTIKGELVKEWSGINEAAKTNGYRLNTLIDCCKHKILTAYGYIWEYVGRTDIPPRKPVKKKLVVQMTMDGQEIATFAGSVEAQKATGVFHSNIRNCCRGVYKQAGGYKWKYKEPKFE